MSARAGRWPIVRFILLLLVWVILIGTSPVDLVIGVLAAAFAAHASRKLVPGSAARPSPAALLSFLGYFLRQSILAGVDIARRAFDPAMPLRPGVTRFRPSLPEGVPRSLFATVSSMVPGTLPCGPAGGGAILVHCLDTEAPVASQMKDDEAHFARAIGSARHHG